MYIVAKRKWRYPLSIEREYAKILVAYVKQKIQTIKTFLPDLEALAQNYNAASADVLLDLIARKTQGAGSMQTQVSRIYARVDSYNETEFTSICYSVFGTGLAGIASNRQDADDLQALKEAWVQQNLDLIKSIDSRTMERIRQALSDAIIQNVSSAELSKYLRDEIQKLAGTTVSRATLIGVDQVGKLNGMMTQYRQQYAGIDRYEWETAHDSRVRPAHRARQGKIYRWDEPPADGNPGMPIRCRCVALPVFDMEKVPIRTKMGTFVVVKTVELKAKPKRKRAQKKQLLTPLQENTTKLKKTLKKDYDEYIGILDENDILKPMYSSYADGVTKISKLKKGGVYYPGENRITWNYREERYVKNGMSKFSTLVHEYGHYFDARAKFNGLTYKEIDAINDIAREKRFSMGVFSRKASNSDYFLNAVRADKEHVKALLFSKSEQAAKNHEEVKKDITHGIQDALDGFFRRETGLVRWGHGDKYYNRYYKTMCNRGINKDVEALYKSMGLDVDASREAEKAAKTMMESRIYDTASELWANINVAVFAGGEELKLMKKYFPNAYKAFVDIMKKGEYKNE